MGDENAATLDWWAPSIAVAGVGVLGYLMMGLYGKKGKMTKLEKACVAFVIAVSEKVEELVKRNAQLEETVASTDRKLADTQERVHRLAAELRDATDRANRAEARVEELQPRAKVHHRRARS
jgi:septal ring factor EnvC (AmiA/AmiB activator)